MSSEYYSYHTRLGSQQDDIWAPFVSKLDWEVARWAKLRGPGSTALTELLKIEGVYEALGLSFKTADELNKKIDSLPSRRPRFRREELLLGGEVFEVYYRDVIECIRALYGDPEFSQHLVFVPECHYTDENCTNRMYFDMHTGKWWWNTQKAVEANMPGATIIPVIISTDKTQVTLFGNKSAYPIYMTIGNLPKEIRRKPSRGGHVLLGYLPTTRLDHLTNKAARRRALANLFHSCVRRILQPLKTAGQEGLAMVSGDGVCQRCHPIFAAFVGDYPEQLLVAAVKTGECPKCPVPHDELGDYDEDAEYTLRDMEQVLDALATLSDGAATFVNSCKLAGIKPIQNPFWEEFPYVNIYQSITPDILHQLYQGVIKHVISWVTKACGAAEVDARCRRFPPNHGIRIFAKGISSLSRVTGREHAQMCQVLLGLVMDVQLPRRGASARLVRAVRALLDFLYLAQYPVHTNETLDVMREALRRFHNDKDIFVELEIREQFNIPKLHALLHYFMSIELFGTTDNYNTEYTERLHIDFAKDAYRATNHKDEYPQMTIWLECREKVSHHTQYVAWRLADSPLPAQAPKVPIRTNTTHIRMARHPTLKAVPLMRMRKDYGARFFVDAFARFVAQYNHPSFTPTQVEDAAGDVFLPFQTLPVFHMIKFTNEDLLRVGSAVETLDAVHVRPAKSDPRGRPVPARFDTVLVNLGSGKELGLTGYRVAQVRVVFTLPPRAIAALFPRRQPPKHLAYVEWFTPFSRSPEPNSRLNKVSRSVRNSDRLASVIPVLQIRRSVHLYPKWGPSVPRDWSSSTVLDDAVVFYVNPFVDRHSYITQF
ncbi:hypothetical protein GLOTRDRAFT_44196 [Gloeophyllum trabeum ATCC 11539]|uniref:Uncharacterized protein n=1 Tax=Gloeophyllum trabeum (strain ATCC 11539 / FP-39264 / Madison 617) TaxID=670483 RepID=S7Q3K1_GLOTA|nr:uncharacterized protein GLOTRDRAFT_44196 [Gloeophyllum trabeum ATCC 11539]EPQ54137.1 hypothetical protein GLOTRDRAFT_44196 [Gloeophyllum trabeum ATCC 11539]